MEELDFNTFEDFQLKFPLDEITLPICIQPPDDASDYWLIQVELPMKEKVINCAIWKANTHQITKYKMKSLKIYKDAVGIAYEQEKRYKGK